MSLILHEPCATSTIQLAAQLFEPSQHVFLQPRQPYELRRAVRHLSTHHHSTRASAQRRAELRSNHEAPSVPPPVGRRTRGRPPNIMRARPSPRASRTPTRTRVSRRSSTRTTSSGSNSKNKVTVDRLGEIRGTKTYERILELDSKDKIPAAYEIGDKLYNFWQDDQHVQGICRASLDSYKSDNVEWVTVLDIDALPPPTKDTAKTWVCTARTLDDGNF